MTTKQLMKYAKNQLKNYNDVFFFANPGRWIRPYAPNGEKYGIAYANTNKLINYANSIDNAKEMIDDFINYCEYMERGNSNES